MTTITAADVIDFIQKSNLTVQVKKAILRLASNIYTCKTHEDAIANLCVLVLIYGVEEKH